MKTKEEYDKMICDFERIKLEFIEVTHKHLNTFMPLSDEDEEVVLLKILGLLGSEHRRNDGN